MLLMFTLRQHTGVSTGANTTQTHTANTTNTGNGKRVGLGDIYASFSYSGVTSKLPPGSDGERTDRS